MKINKLNLSNPITIITIVCFLGVIIFSVMVLWPRFQDMEEIRESVMGVKQTLEQREVHFLKAKKDRDRLEGYQEQLAKIRFALPDDVELSALTFFRFLQKTTIETGLILTEVGAFAISSPEERPEIQKTQFDFQVKGPYTAFKTFLVRLEKSARIIKVEEISFSAPDEGGLFTFDIRIRVHSY